MVQNVSYTYVCLVDVRVVSQCRLLRKNIKYNPRGTAAVVYHFIGDKIGRANAFRNQVSMGVKVCMFKWVAHVIICESFTGLYSACIWKFMPIFWGRCMWYMFGTFQ